MNVITNTIKLLLMYFLISLNTYPSFRYLKTWLQVSILMTAPSLNESLACYDMKVIQIPSIWLLMIAAIAPLSLLSRDGNLSFAWAWIFSPKPMIYYKSTTDCHSSLSLTCHCNVHSIQLVDWKCPVLFLFKKALVIS